MKLRLLFVLLFCASLTLKAQELIENNQSLTIEEANRNYYTAVKSRNLDILLSYVSKSKDIPFVMADGSLIKTNEEYKNFHINWFADKKWDVEFEVINITKNESTAITIAKSNYYANKEDRSQSGAAIVTLIYAKEDGMWKVIGDVCSDIAKK